MGKMPTEMEIVGQGFRKIEQDMKQVVDHVNGWVAKIDGIDNVAFAVLYMMVNKTDKFVLTDKGIEKTQAAIADIVEQIHKRREALAKKAEAEAAKGKKKVAKDGDKKIILSK